MISNFRFPKKGLGSSVPGRWRKRTKLIPIMLATINRMNTQITSTSVNESEIAAACEEAVSKIGLKFVGIH